MSGYEVEHGLAKSPDQEQDQSSQRPRRPDLSTFFSTLELVDTSGEQQSQNNVHALPLPADVSAAYRNLANAFEMMRGDGNDLMESLVEELMRSADDPPTKVEGVPDSFLDELDRVPKKSLKPTDSCPICGNPFLEDEYPLVVVLPCSPMHKFDMECIRPWLKLNPTCPLDRKNLLKKKVPPPPPADDDEEDYDDYYA